MNTLPPPDPGTATIVTEPPQTAYIPVYAPAGYPPQSARHRSAGGRDGIPTWGWVALGATVLAVVVIIASVAFAFLYAGSTGAVGTAALGGPTPLEKAREACASGSDYVVLKDDGRTLDIDTQGEEQSYGASEAQLDCVLDELEVPGSVQSKLGNTRALDGMQSADWDGFSASWNYHPDRGVNMVIAMT